MKLYNSSFPSNTLLLYARSALFLSCQMTLTIIIPTLILIGYKTPFRVRYGLANLWVRIVLWLSDKICGLSYQVEGVENIPEENAIIFCKHQSAWETIVLQAIFPPVVFILKRELLQLPFFGWALNLQEPISINRESKRAALKEVIKQGTDRLQKGRWVVIFPEGTRAAPGEKKKYAVGGAMLAEKSGYAVIPVAHNAGSHWGRHSFLKYPGVIQVRIGPAIQSAGLKARKINEQAEIWIEKQMVEIQPA